MNKTKNIPMTSEGFAEWLIQIQEVFRHNKIFVTFSLINGVVALVSCQVADNAHLSTQPLFELPKADAQNKFDYVG